MAVTYELYIKQKGRWNFEAHFAGHLRGAALAEAKEIEPHVEAAKIIREQTDPDGTVRESTIYNSERAKTGRLTTEQRQAATSRTPRVASSRTPSRAPRDAADFVLPVNNDAKINNDMEDDLEGGQGGTYAATRALSRRPSGGASNTMGPEALVLTKLFLIVTCSFAFASFVTWLFLRSGIVTA